LSLSAFTIACPIPLLPPVTNEIIVSPFGYCAI
jgi:hypothetical protein